MDALEIFPIQNPLRLSQICATIGGDHKVIGDGDPLVTTVAPLDQGDATSLSFCRFSGEDARARILQSQAAVVVCCEDVSPVSGRTLVVVADPRGWFIDALTMLTGGESTAGIHPTALVSPEARLGIGVAVGPHVVIEAGATVGDGCRIGAFAYIAGAAVLETNVTVQPYTAIGTTGLSFHERPNGEHVFFPHVGLAIVRTGASIGAHSTIVRGILKNTEVGAGSEVGNYVNIGHNCRVGAGCFVSSGTILTGGVELGDGARLAAGVNVTSHCKIGAGAHVGLGSVVVKDIADEQRYFGNPARPLPTMRDF